MTATKQKAKRNPSTTIFTPRFQYRDVLPVVAQTLAVNPNSGVDGKFWTSPRQKAYGRRHAICCRPSVWTVPPPPTFWFVHV